jgi:hypothetical protein
MKHLKHLKQTLGRMEARRRVNFTGVELVGDTEITALMEKATTGLVEKAAVGLHTVLVVSSVASCARGKLRCELCVDEFHLGRRELRAGEIHPGQGELAKQSARCA